MYFVNCKLPVKYAFVFSVIVQQFHFGERCSQRLIAELGGFDRGRTLQDILRRLTKLKIVTEQAGSLVPIEPPGENKELFAWKMKGKEWWERLAYFKFYHRSASSSLSQLENVVYWKLTDLVETGNTWQTYNGLATLLHASRSGIKRAISKLAEVNLITIQPVRKGFYVSIVLPLGDKEEWFQFKKEHKQTASSQEQGERAASQEPKQEKKALATYDGEDWRTSAWRHVINSIIEEDPSSKWLQEEFPIEFYNLAVPHYYDTYGNHDWKWLASLVADCRRQHNKTGEAKTCAYLVLNTLKKRIAFPDTGFDYFVDRSDEVDEMEEAVRRIDNSRVIYE